MVRRPSPQFTCAKLDSVEVETRNIHYHTCSKKHNLSYLAEYPVAPEISLSLRIRLTQQASTLGAICPI